MTSEKFSLIAEDLRGRIRSGELGPGAYLPTHPELAKEYGTTRMTIRRALEELTREGFLVSEPKKGVMVRDLDRMTLEVGQGFAPPFPNLAERLADSLIANRLVTRTIRVTYARPAPGVTRRLRTEGALAVIRNQIVRAAGHPIAIETYSVPKRIAAGTLLEHPDPDLDVLTTLDDIGMPVTTVRKELLVRQALVEESRAMRWATGSPVLVHIQTGHTADGLPVSCLVQVLPGDTWIVADWAPRALPLREPAMC